jgi:secreted trypsin-like serine protease
MRKLSILIAVLATTLTVGAVSASAIVGGTDDQGAHPYVGAALQFYPDGSFQLCSGSLISARIFVTAAHCFPEGSQVEITFEENALTSSTFYTGTAHLHPDWCLECGNGLPGYDTHDVAVIVLDGAGAPQTRYAQLPKIGQGNKLPNNQVVQVLGYGVQELVKKTPTLFGTRKVGQAKLINGAGTLAYEYLKVSGKAGTCYGDSGGPVLLAGTDTMIAINTFLNGNPRCAGLAYAERLDRPDIQNFIKSFR